MSRELFKRYTFLVALLFSSLFLGNCSQIPQTSVSTTSLTVNLDDIQKEELEKTVVTVNGQEKLLDIGENKIKFDNLSLGEAKVKIQKFFKNGSIDTTENTLSLIAQNENQFQVQGNDSKNLTDYISSFSHNIAVMCPSSKVIINPIKLDTKKDDVVVSTSNESCFQRFSFKKQKNRTYVIYVTDTTVESNNLVVTNHWDSTIIDKNFFNVKKEGKEYTVIVDSTSDSSYFFNITTARNTTSYFKLRVKELLIPKENSICSLPIDRNSVIKTTKNHLYSILITTNDLSQVNTISLEGNSNNFSSLDYPIKSTKIPNGKILNYYSKSDGVFNYKIKVSNDCKGYYLTVIDLKINEIDLDDSFDLDEYIETYSYQNNLSTFTTKSFTIKGNSNGMMFESTIDPILLSSCTSAGATGGFILSGGASVLCDYVSGGTCAVINPSIIATGTGIGGVLGAGACSIVPVIGSFGQIALENAIQNTTSVIDSAKVKLENSAGDIIIGTITLYKATSQVISGTNVGNPTRARSKSFSNDCKPNNQIAHHIIAFASKFALDSRIIVDGCAKKEGKVLEDIIDEFTSNGICLDKSEHDGLHKKKEYYEPINYCIDVANKKGGCKAVYSMINKVGKMIKTDKVRDFTNFKNNNCGY